MVRNPDHGEGVPLAVLKQRIAKFPTAFRARLRVHDLPKGILCHPAIGNRKVAIRQVWSDGRQNRFDRPGAAHVRVVVIRPCKR